jgi:hypothetical protein
VSFINIDDDVTHYVAMRRLFDKIPGLSDKHRFELLPFAVDRKFLCLFGPIATATKEPQAPAALRPGPG